MHRRKKRIGIVPLSAYLCTMSLFRFQGIPDALAAEVRTTLRSPQYGHPAHRELAQRRRRGRAHPLHLPAVPGAGQPARARTGLHPRSRMRTLRRRELPPDLRSLPLVFEAYRAGGDLLAQERVGDRLADEALATIYGYRPDGRAAPISGVFRAAPSRRD
jgi:hypothetical protein